MNSILLAMLLSLAPLQGLATYYGPPGFWQGKVMANGQPLDLWGPTVAVDDSLEGLLNQPVVVITECGTVHKVTVTDTGYFDEKCRLFRRGRKRVGNWVQERYWCVEWVLPEGTPVITDTIVVDDVDWAEEKKWPVVADFPQWYFAHIACEVDAYGHGDTMRVGIYPWTEAWEVFFE